ncbi:hypothetical protein QUF73_20735 [Cytobacillus sp. NJ13]|nr:hypothetical protein [Cytobacillus sp. NJ13]
MKPSVLDQSVVAKGDTAVETFRKTAKLAQLAEDLGLSRQAEFVHPAGRSFRLKLKMCNSQLIHGLRIIFIFELPIISKCA